MHGFVERSVVEGDGHSVHGFVERLYEGTACTVSSSAASSKAIRCRGTMQRAALLQETLQAAFSPTHLEVLDESSNHAVKPGAQSHFRVVVVSTAFEGKSALARHKMVYAAVEQALREGLHALAITSRTPAEWDASPEALRSPPCAGANRAS